MDKTIENAESMSDETKEFFDYVSYSFIPKQNWVNLVHRT